MMSAMEKNKAKIRDIIAPIFLKNNFLKTLFIYF